MYNFCIITLYNLFLVQTRLFKAYSIREKLFRSLNGLMLFVNLYPFIRQNALADSITKS